MGTIETKRIQLKYGGVELNFAVDAVFYGETASRNGVMHAATIVMAQTEGVNGSHDLITFIETNGVAPVKTLCQIKFLGTSKSIDMTLK